MIGLDRAGVYVELENVEADLIILGIRKKFSQAEPRKLAGATQTFKINTRNINEIRVTDRFYKVLVRIDFSYPRYFEDDNLIPLATDIQKQEVENDLCELIYEISLQKFKREFLFYDYLELCTQENIQSFYSYHNIISLFYKALKRKNDVKIGTRYEDYDLNSDVFYSTRFSFQMAPGWKIKLYNKTIEHNKHNEEKIKGGTIRLEHLLTRSLIIRYCGDSKVSNIKISEAKRVDTETKKYKLGILKREYHHVDEVTLLITDMITRCKSKLNSIPARANVELLNISEPREMEQKLKKLINECLKKLSTYDKLSMEDIEIETEGD